MLERLIVLVTVLTTMPVAAMDIVPDRTLSRRGALVAPSAIDAHEVF